MTALCGYYGKIPAHGDFIKYRLPRAFVEPWDDWLQTALARSREQLAGDWLDAYLTSPLYRFALTPGICGESGWLGVLMPSVDRVGRYFPMTLCTSTEADINPLRAMTREEAWFEQAEDLALTCLEDEFEHAAFNDAVAQLEHTLLSDEAPTSAPANTPENNTGHLALQHPLEQLSRLPDLYPALLNDVLKESCFAYSLWWSSGSEQVAASLLLTRGLPPAGSLAALFDGNWTRWGWQTGACILQPPGRLSGNRRRGG